MPARAEMAPFRVTSSDSPWWLSSATPYPPKLTGYVVTDTGSGLSTAVVAALHGLPARQREALVLRYYADLSEAQIASALGIEAMISAL